MKRIEKGYYKDTYKGVEFTIDYDKSLEGELKWVIMYTNYDYQDLVFGHEDQLWYTKREAEFQAKFYIDTIINN